MIFLLLIAIVIAAASAAAVNDAAVSLWEKYQARRRPQVREMCGPVVSEITRWENKRVR